MSGETNCCAHLSPERLGPGERSKVATAGQTGGMITPDAQITCIDCGGRCHLLSMPREDGVWLPGDWVAYRCEDCLDRWDLQIPEDAEDDAARGDAAGEDWL